MHSDSALDPVPRVAVPLGHGEHWVEATRPSVADHELSGHGEHCAEDVPPTLSRNVPAGQRKHSTRPTLEP